MSAPPGLLATTETAAGHDRQEGDTAPSKRGAIRYLCTHLDIAGAQAHKLVDAWISDVRDAQRVGNDTDMSDAGFIDWLMRQAPGPGRQRKVLQRPWAGLR